MIASLAAADEEHRNCITQPLSLTHLDITIQHTGMSARHLQALRTPGLGEALDNPELDEEEDEEEEVAARGGFHLLLDSSDEEEEDDDNDAREWESGEADEEEKEEKNPVPQQPAPQAARKPNKKAVVEEEEDEDAWLEIQRQAVGGGEGGDATTSSSTLQSPLYVAADALEMDTKSLSLDKELKSRFGDEGVGEGGGGGGGGGGRRRGAALGRGNASAGGGVLGQLYQRRCFFGAPKEDWPRPPTYVGGGFRMVRSEAPADCENEEEAGASWFAFEWSPAFQALQQDYELVQETCDPNALAVFLAHHPHHAEGLLTLALIYATHGT